VIAACVAGAGAEVGRRRIARILSERFPAAAVHVFPDYIGAWMAAPADTDILVIAGTGSIICSRTRDGEFHTAGGHGWILGDHGSAVRLGRALLEHYCAGSEKGLAAEIGHLFGTSAPAELAVTVQSSPTPAALLARAAPLLTAAAETGEAWAERLVDSEMFALAGTLRSHLANERIPPRDVRVALSGSVWSSGAAREGFADALAHMGVVARLDHLDVEMTEGTVRLAVALSDGQPAEH
jgi:glucosamine kinase